MEIDLKNVVHSVSVSGGTLNANQVATVSLYLGSSASQISNAYGVRLELVLSADAYLPSNPLSVTVSGSWLLSDVDVAQTLEVDGPLQTMSLTLERDPAGGPASGHGFALSFPLVIANNGVTASTIVESYGGVVIIENVDMRLSGTNSGCMNTPIPVNEIQDDAAAPSRIPSRCAPQDNAPLQVAELAEASELEPSMPAAAKGLRFYPNPCMDQIHTELPSDADAELRLVGMDGVVYSMEMTTEGGIGVADIVPMKRGVYFAEVVQAGKVVLRQRIQLTTGN